MFANAQLQTSAILIALICGCATHAERVQQGREWFYRGDLAQAQAVLQKVAPGLHRDGDCLELDRAMIALADGRPAEAERSLREVRDRFDFLEQHDLAESAVALLTDDGRRAYSGEDYEKVLIRAMLATASLLQGGDDAIAYSHQIEQKQQEVIGRGVKGLAENPKAAYQPVAFGPYLQGVLSEATHSQYDDAARSFAKVVSFQPQNPTFQMDLLRAEHGTHSQTGNGVVHVIAFVGRGPFKEECVELPTSEALLIADRLLSMVGSYQLPPTIAPIKVPRVVIPRNEVDSVAIRVGGQPAGATHTVTDVGQLAVSQDRALASHTIARAVVRRVVKKGIAYGVQDAVDVDNPWLEMGILATGVAWEFTESADTRCWGLLPNQIQVLRLELPAGLHSMDLSAARSGVPIGPPQSCDVPVHDGENTYLFAYFPSQQLAGRIQVSRSN